MHRKRVNLSIFLWNNHWSLVELRLCYFLIHRIRVNLKAFFGDEHLIFKLHSCVTPLYAIFLWQLLPNNFPCIILYLI